MVNETRQTTNQP